VAVALGTASPDLHCSTYAFWVMPRACIPALSALHSATHSLAVFREVDVPVCDGAGRGAGALGAACGAATTGVVTIFCVCPRSRRKTELCNFRMAGLIIGGRENSCSPTVCRSKFWIA
jgi:hypothetical protein